MTADGIRVTVEKMLRFSSLRISVPIAHAAQNR